MAITFPTATFSSITRRIIGVFPGIRPAFDVSRRFARPAFLGILTVLALPATADAFSQITREDGQVLGRDDIISTPLPPLDPDGSGTAPDWGRAQPQDIDPSTPPTNDLPEDIETIEDVPALPVRYGEEGLPTPVRDLRARLMEIAAAGEIEALRPYLETGANPTAISIVPIEDDSIEFLKSASGDGEGVEILAILLEILDSGHVQIEPGGESEIFVWPYFTQVPLEGLSPPQLVELFEIVTAGDYRGMLDVGAYDFYRVGISPGGRLEFFLAGD